MVVGSTRLGTRVSAKTPGCARRVRICDETPRGSASCHILRCNRPRLSSLETGIVSGVDLEEWNTLSDSGEENHPSEPERRMQKVGMDKDFPNPHGYRGARLMSAERYDSHSPARYDLRW